MNQQININNNKRDGQTQSGGLMLNGPDGKISIHECWHL